MAPYVSVIIVNYNSGARLEKCLAHLAAQTFTDFETIVVDNASTDGSAQAVAGAGFRVELIEAGKNLGFAAANNLAVKSVRSEWVAFLNPDAYAAPDWLDAFAAGVRKYPGIGVFGSTQLCADNPATLDGAGDVCHALGLYFRGLVGRAVEHAPGDGECFSACAAAAFFRRDVFETLGGFDERFFCYGEDIDLGFRHRLSGGRAVHLRGAIVLHEGSGVTGRHSEFSTFYGVRNRLWVYYKNLPATALIALAPVHIGVNLVMLARSAMIGRAGAHWRGLRDGVAGFGRLKQARAKIQNERMISTIAILQSMTWSPLKLWTRSADIRSYKGKAG